MEYTLLTAVSNDSLVTDPQPLLADSAWKDILYQKVTKNFEPLKLVYRMSSCFS